MNSDIYFISDCHLSADNTETLKLFFRFIKRIEGCDALYILGDLFDVWVGDDNISPIARAVQNALARLHANGTTVHFMHGNRDFLLGARFARQARWFPLGDYFVNHGHGHKFLLTHGDLLCADDREYLRYRKVARNALVKMLYLSLPLKYRKRVAQKLRKKSKEHQQQVDSYTTDACPQAVYDTMKKFNCKLMIHGHTHKPKHHHYSWGDRYVLGDWHAKRAIILKLTEKGPELINIAESAQENRDDQVAVA